MESERPARARGSRTPSRDASTAGGARGRAATPPRGTLNRDLIAAVALQQVDELGLEALTMRRLGAALGVEAMAIYHHFRNKDELLDALMERMLDEVEVPDDPKIPPLRRLRTCIESYRRLALRHPNAFVLLASRRFNSERAFEFYERVLELLEQAGLDPALSARFFRLMGNYTSGSGLADIASRPRSRGAATLRLERGDIDAWFPRVSAVAPHLRAGNLDAIYDFGMDVIFDAIRRTVKRRA
jgi:AcrR family transcriptional regulator